MTKGSNEILAEVHANVCKKSLTRETVLVGGGERVQGIFD